MTPSIYVNRVLDLSGIGDAGRSDPTRPDGGVMTDVAAARIRTRDGVEHTEGGPLDRGARGLVARHRRAPT